MMPKLCPVLKSGHNKRQKCSSSGEESDLLSALPHDIQLLILSSFTIREAARLSLVSQNWEFLWRCSSVLRFEDSRAIERIESDRKYLNRLESERHNFVRWVDSVVEQHKGLVVDEFKVTFNMIRKNQANVNKWVAFALEKKVHRIELDFLTPWGSTARKSEQCCSLRLTPFGEPSSLASYKTSLTSLCLKNINVSDKLADILISSCVFLENLCIVGSISLTRVRISSSLFQLKHLEVSRCFRLISVHISAPKLLTFTYCGQPIVLDITRAPLLSEVSIGEQKQNYSLAYVFDALSAYLSQLKHLCLMISFRGELNMDITNVPVLKNLRQLELRVNADVYQSLLGWCSLIEASPLLQKLTLELNSGCLIIERRILKRRGHPLKSLKTLEIFGYMGKPIDLEFATYVLENAIALEEVVVDVTHPFYKVPNKSVQLVELERVLPESVKLIIK